MQLLGGRGGGVSRNHMLFSTIRFKAHNIKQSKLLITKYEYIHSNTKNTPLQSNIALDILLGIPNYGKNKDIDILNFVILFAKSYIYDCKKNEMVIDLYNFHMVIQEHICKVYNKTEEFESMWASLADSL